MNKQNSKNNNHGSNTTRRIQEMQREKINHYLELFFIYFILAQPFLDLFSYMGGILSEIVRVLAMGLGVIYLFTMPQIKGKILSIVYLFVVAVVLLLNFANNFLIKSPFFMMEELTYGIKTGFVIEMILVYTFVFLSLSKKIDWQQLVQRNIFINMTVIGIVMVLATLTDTAKRSYGMLVKMGHSGWFFSANELGAILTFGFGIMILYFMKKQTLKQKLWLVPSILLVIWSMFMLGTKVGLGGVLLVLGIGTIFALAWLFIKKRHMLNFGLLTAIFLVSFFYIPYSAVGNNLSFTLFTPDQTPGAVGPDGEVEPELNEDGEVIEEVQDDTVGRVLSSRNEYLADTIAQFKEAPLSQKLIGMGPGGNYEEEPKLIEMDYLDWFFGYGIIGFILLVGLLVYYIYAIFKQIIIQRFKPLLDVNVLIVGSTVALGFGIALFAGHIFLNPASGVYFAIMLSYLYVLLQKPMHR